ncbi:hypothetical protein L1049_012327 [Liquidambar formosana]|uniref:Ribonuclease n=1 Tax=Liquidambar formosana TaxID=63359 RepID=A0AAP0RT53_LIQFO
MGPEAPLPKWASKPCIMGIDEAGRGPVLGSPLLPFCFTMYIVQLLLAFLFCKIVFFVSFILGPMVYGCLYCALSYQKTLSSLNFADSKTLKEEKREELFENLKVDESIGWAVDVIDPRELSAKMLKKNKINLNEISHDSASGLVARIEELVAAESLTNSKLAKLEKESKYWERRGFVFLPLRGTFGKTHNKEVISNHQSTLTKVMHLIFSFVDNLRIAFDPHLETSSPPPPLPSLLDLLNGLNPLKVMFKINTDGSCYGNPDPTAVGGLFRNDQGGWLMGFAFKMGYSFSTETELCGIRMGLKLAWDNGRI